MKRCYINIAVVLLMVTSLCLTTQTGVAGNKDRAGQGGAGELLINPWARSSGWASANSASIRGLEAMYLNVAGSAFTKGTEVVFSHTSWLKGTDININAFGITQKMGESGVIGLSIMSMDFGDIEVTTVNNPEGGIGTYSPQFLNLGLSYAKVFSNSIYGGINIKIISESVGNLSAQGFAFDAGIQYVTGFNEDKDNLKFGIALKNVGPPMKFEGDGLSFKGIVPSNSVSLSVEQRSETFELPSLINIGATYDFKLAEDHRLSLAGTFTSNSFTSDRYNLGLEYGFKNYFMVRGGFAYEEDIFDDAKRTTALTGPTAGATFEIPFGKSGKTFGLDYSFRATDPFDGIHAFGARINL